MIELSSLGQWRVCLDAHTMARAPTSNVIAEKERVLFDLVNSRHHLRQLQNSRRQRKVELVPDSVASTETRFGKSENKRSKQPRVRDTAQVVPAVISSV